MEYRAIPGTGLRVSTLGFGNFVFGTDWWGKFSDQEGVRLQNQAFDLGVNFFDTAAAYGSGRAESLLAQTIRYAGRDNLVVSTKFGYDFYSDPGLGSGNPNHRERPQDFSPKFLRHDLEQSLARLGIDCIDLYQAHNLKLPQFRDELFATLEQFRAQGKIRYWGVALGPAIGWREEGRQAFLERDAATLQTVFNLYEQDPGREFCQIAQARARGGVIARVPTNSGILDEEFTSPDHAFPNWDHRKFRDRNWLVYGLQKNEILRPLARSCGLSLRQLAFAWLDSFPAVVAVEPNLLKPEDLTAFAAAAGRTLPPDLLTRLADLYATDFGLGPAAHPCHLKSSTSPTGSVPSSCAISSLPDLPNPAPARAPHATCP
jgi:aryl-alcohol dehydrogenase-like predicted oxidoreductase